MAAAHMHATLDLPDDEMEISSEVERVQHYDDNDIDIDLMDPREDDQDIDYMLEDEDQVQEDHEPDVQVSGRDDVMIDEIEDATIVEEPMRDDETVPEARIDNIISLNVPVNVHGLDTYNSQLSVLEPNPEIVAESQAEQEKVLETMSIQIEQSGHTGHDSSTLGVPDPPHGYTSALSTIRAPPLEDEIDQILYGDIHDLDAQGQDRESKQIDIFDESENEASSASWPADNVPDTTSVQIEAKPSTAAPDALSAQEDEGNDYEHEEDDGDVEVDERSTTHPTSLARHLDIANAQTVALSDNRMLGSETDNPTRAEASAALIELHGETDSIWPYASSVCHPVIVEYESMHMSLFPPTDEDSSGTYLLQDTSMADKSLVELFRECRQVLGESIKDGEELEIACAELSLQISEDSIHCADTSLSQIIDVYVTLMRQDGVEEPEPLSIRLTTKSRFSTRLEYLFRAASEAKGISELQLAESKNVDILNTESYVEQKYQEHDSTDASEILSNEALGSEARRSEASLEASRAATNAVNVFGVGGPMNELSEVGRDLEEYPGGDPAQHDERSNNTDGNLDGDENPEDVDDNARYLDRAFVEEEYAGAEPIVSDGTPTSSVGDGGVERDVESPGSSTIQGENDVAQHRQSSFSMAHDDNLIMSTDATNDESFQGLVSLPDGKSISTTALNVDGNPVEAYDVYPRVVHATQHAEIVEAAHVEKPSDRAPAEDIDGLYNDLEEIVDEWDPAKYEGGRVDRDQLLENSLHEDGGGDASPEESWDPYDEATAEGHDDTLIIAAGLSQSTSGTLQVPVSMPEGGEDEDSISYDDELDDDDVLEPAIPTGQTTSRESPLGKRSRTPNQENGRKNCRDQAKRLKSH